MNSVKQIVLILSMLCVASALEKGVSARKPIAGVENHRGLKKSSKKSSSKKSGGGGFYGSGNAPNRGGGIGSGGTVPVGDGSVNRDGTTPGALIEPKNKDCVPFDEARKWLTEEYPGDIQCRVETGQMGTTSACCRVFTFTDTTGPQKWLLYDINNQYRDLMCVCNENTKTPGGGTSNNPVINVPPGPGNTPGDSPNGDRTGGVGNNPLNNPGMPSAPALPPAAAPAISTGPGGVCDNPNPTQLALQDSPYMVPCEDSSPCGDNKCCFSNYCVCWPVSQLVPGTSYCL